MRRLFVVLAILSAILSAAPLWAAAGQIQVVVHGATGAPVADAVVIARGPGSTAKPATAIIDQVDKQFVPFVSVFPVGTVVTFPNQDDIRHHVYSFSPAKRFELPLYQGTPAAPVTFDKPGVIALGCNIHDWMLAYVYVTDAPAFGKTDDNGIVQLSSLEAGEWHVTAWHPDVRGGKDSPPQSVTVGGEAATTVDLALQLDPAKQRRRAPRGEDTRY